MTETLKSTVGAKINDVANILKGTTAQVYVKAKEGDARFLGWTKGVSFEEVVEKGSAMGDGALGTIAGTEYYTKLNAKTVKTSAVLKRCQRLLLTGSKRLT